MTSNFNLDKGYINTKCLEYFNNELIPILNDVYKNYDIDKKNKLLSEIESLSYEDKRRLGWYLLALEVLCEISSDIDRKNLIEKSIIDQKFNQIIFNEDISPDLGIDVVYIKESDCEADIRLFNFKYREDQDENSGQKESEALSSYDFLSTLKDKKLNNNAKGKTKKRIEDIQRVLENKIAKTTFYMVTNDNNKLPNSKSLDTFSKTFNIQIEPITQQDISNRILDKISCNCNFISDANSMFEYNDTAGIKSIITKISAFELLRITCRDNKLRNKECIYNKKDIDLVSSYEMEFNLLNDNVRGYIKNTTNSNIVETLENQSNKFFIFNNGLTIVSDQLDIIPINLNTKNILKLNNFQVVNGGQTLRNIYEYKSKINNYSKDDDKYKLISNLQKSFILLRIFSLSDLSIKKDIAKYTNSQTAISEGQLRAFNREQLIIEKELAKHSIKYIFKDGNFGEENSEDAHNNHSILMVELAQILDSVENLKPYRAAGRKQDLIESYYDEIFKDSNIKYTQYHIYINLYYQIRETLEHWIKNKDPKLKSISDVCNYSKARIDSQLKFIINLTLYILYVLKRQNDMSLDKIENKTESSIKLIMKSVKVVNNKDSELEVSTLNKMFTKSDICNDIDNNIKLNR